MLWGVTITCRCCGVAGGCRYCGDDEGVIIVADIIDIVYVCDYGVIDRFGTLHPRKSLTLFIL